MIDKSTISMSSNINNFNKKSKLSVLSSTKICQSPNTSCCAIIANDNSLIISHLNNFIFKEVKSASQTLSSYIELSILKQINSWDIMVSMLFNLKSKGHERGALFHWTLCNLQEDCKNSNSRQILKLEVIKSILYRIIDGQEVNYIDTQLKLIIALLTNITCSNLNSTTWKSIEMLATSNYEMKKCVEMLESHNISDVSYSFNSDFVIDLCSFVSKNLLHFIEVLAIEDLDSSSLLFNIPPGNNKN